MKSLINHFKTSPIPTWINIVQILLTMIVIQQTYQFYFDIDAVSASGITTEGIPNKNLIYEFAGRTGTMAVISILIMLNPVMPNGNIFNNYLNILYYYIFALNFLIINKKFF